MRTLLEPLKRCAESHSFDTGDPDNPVVLDQLYRAYAESHETDPPEIKDCFKELDTYLRQRLLDDNNAVWNLCCHLCPAYEHKAFVSDHFCKGSQLVPCHIR